VTICLSHIDCAPEKGNFTQEGALSRKNFLAAALRDKQAAEKGKDAGNYEGKTIPPGLKPRLFCWPYRHD
jgi:hypothetical protein